MAEVLARLDDVHVHFPVREGLLLPREVARVRAVEHRSGTEKQQALEQSVIERVIERGNQTVPIVITIASP